MWVPPDIITDVLSRLPVKSLLRFRSLSKPLCSTIDGLYFAKLHLHHSKKSLVFESFSLYSIEWPSLERVVRMDHHPLNSLPGGTTIFGSCNGLLCLYNDDTHTLALWNKSTGNHLLVPSTPIAFPHKSSHKDKRLTRVSYGLAHDSVQDDYKLVRIVQFYNTSATEVRVYSMKSNSWREIRGFTYDLLCWRSEGVLVDGALHWPALRRNDEGSLVIVAFDPSTEVFREVPTPPCGETFVLLALENQLCAVYNFLRGKTDVWIMKECWEILLSIPKSPVSGFMIPVAYLSNGDVLLLKNHDSFLAYDLKRKMVNDNVMVKGMRETYDIFMYVDSLVNPLPTVVNPTVSGDGASVEKQKGLSDKNNAAKN